MHNFVHATAQVRRSEGAAVRRVLRSSVMLYDMAGRRQLTEREEMSILAWLSLGASLEGEAADQMKRVLQEGTDQHRALLNKACWRGLNAVGGSSALR